MRLVALSLLGAVGAITAAATATAAPSVPPVAPGQSAIMQVAGGCGFGWHRNSWGDCVPNGFRMYRHRPDTVIEEWDEYEEY
jgi:hypothetical protein